MNERQTDADLIYNALLRCEKTLEAVAADGNFPHAANMAAIGLVMLQLLREEIGNGLSKEGR